MNYLKNTHKVIALITVLMLSSFTISQLTQEEDVIIGSWSYINENNNKWIFTSDNCSWEYNGNLISIFN